MRSVFYFEKYSITFLIPPICPFIQVFKISGVVLSYLQTKNSSMVKLNSKSKATTYLVYKYSGKLPDVQVGLTFKFSRLGRFKASLNPLL